MAIEQSYKTDAWGVKIFWGRDVTGDKGDEEETTVYLDPVGMMNQNEAVAMAQYILDELVGG